MKSFLAVFTFFMSVAVFASDPVVKVKNSDIEFLATGSPGFLKINGKGGKAESKLVMKNGNVSGEITCDLAAFDTGIGLRNDHMKDKYLQVKKFPKAILKVSNLATSEGEHELVGTLTIKGVTKPAKGKYTVVGAKSVKAEMDIKLSDYPIGIPNYLGVTVAEEVKVKVNADFE